MAPDGATGVPCRRRVRDEPMKAPHALRAQDDLRFMRIARCTLR
jgi:hypothetical protein